MSAGVEGGRPVILVALIPIVKNDAIPFAMRTLQLVSGSTALQAFGYGRA